MLGRMPIYGSILIFLVTVLALNKYLVWYRLRHVPGPRFASLSNLWLLKVALSGKMPAKLHDVCETYGWSFYLTLSRVFLLIHPEGPLSRIGPNDLLCSDPDVIRRMSSARSKYRRSTFYSSFAFNPDRDTMLSTTDENVHADLKVKTAAGVRFPTYEMIQ